MLLVADPKGPSTEITWFGGPGEQGFSSMHAQVGLSRDSPCRILIRSLQSLNTRSSRAPTFCQNPRFIDTLSRWSTNQLNLSIMEGDEQICSIEFGNNLVAFKKLGPSFMTASPNTETPSLLMLNSPFVVYHTTSYASKKESVFFRRQWGLRKCRQPASENQRSANRNEHFK